MNNLQILKKQIEEKRHQALYDSGFGNRELQLQYQGQLNAYDLVLIMIEKMDKPPIYNTHADDSRRTFEDLSEKG